MNKEKIIMWFVWKLPKWLIYWCTIRLGAHATTKKFSNQIVGELKFMDAVKRWEAQ